MKLKLIKIGQCFLLCLAFFSCDNNNQDDNQTPNTPKPNLLSISSNSVGNACNIWNLQSGTLVTSIAFIPVFSNLRTADGIISPAGLLAQTTMTYQSSAYDNVNKKYAVALGETIVTYDFSPIIIPTPITQVIATPGSGSNNFILAMEYVGGQLYIVHNNELKKLISGIPTSFSTPVLLPTIGVTSNTMSNMTKNGTNIYFILKGRLFTFDTVSNSITSAVVISGWSADIDYNGVEYFSGRIFATKRHSATTYATTDEFVTINLSGSESVMTAFPSYVRDWSRISSAVDQATGIYYLSSSNGFAVNTNTLTEINLGSLAATSNLINGYQFGLQIKD
jgi:hypothetical protein